MIRGRSITVAPRELTDLVYRCARTGGIDAGTATDIARLWTEAAIRAASTEQTAAAAHGVVVDQGAFDILCQCAEAFLVAESDLDRIAEA